MLYFAAAVPTTSRYSVGDILATLNPVTVDGVPLKFGIVVDKRDRHDLGNDCMQIFILSTGVAALLWNDNSRFAPGEADEDAFAISVNKEVFETHRTGLSDMLFRALQVAKEQGLFNEPG